MNKSKQDAENIIKSFQEFIDYGSLVNKEWREVSDKEFNRRVKHDAIKISLIHVDKVIDMQLDNKNNYLEIKKELLKMLK